MRKVLTYSFLLLAGLVASQTLPQFQPLQWSIRLLTMVVLSFIMIHVGYEFEIDKNRPRKYLLDYGVAATAAAFPWIFCCLYFVFVVAPPELWGHGDLWKGSLLESRFASPTSAGVLFSMLAAAGLSASWVFQKARVLAIFDDLDTILLLIPLKIMMVGMKWQLVVIVAVIGILLWIAWRFMHQVRLPVSWPYIMLYAAGIAACSEAIFEISAIFDAAAPIHLEVLLPAFVLGCVLKHPTESETALSDLPMASKRQKSAKYNLDEAKEQRVSDWLSGCFMVLVGLSMPPVFAAASDAVGAVSSAVEHVLTFDGVSAQILQAKEAMPSPWMLAFHVLMVTLLSNLGKMFPAFCYRKEASFRERIALSFAMFPRGEVGGGVLVVSIGYGIGGPSITIAVLSLALNLLCTGLFILVVKRLLARGELAAAV